MDNRTVLLLEFDKVFESLMDECISEEGRILLEKQDFFTSKEELSRFHDVVGGIKRYLDSPAVFPYLNFGPVSALAVKAVKPGAVLEGEELVLIAEYLKSAEKLRKYFKSEDISDAEGVRSIVDDFPDSGNTAERITAVLDPSGSVKENHPAIRKLKNDLKGVRSSISKTASVYLGKNKELWQTDTPAERDGRIVLPLKADFKNRVKGIINHVSAKGATLYIEPFELLELNNKATIIENEIIIQIRRILGELTEIVSERSDDILLLAEKISYMDTLIARARYSLKYNCTRAAYSGKSIDIRGARHPLLGKYAVPIDIRMDEDLKVLIITGPNAGGKTVTLKTVGLLALMNQFGMEIPAEEGSLIPVFNNIFADIGDDQSLENALSTFSGHISNIAEIIKNADGRSLILLDELGSGTDPAEGVSIAMAVLDYLLSLNSTVITTSHHGLLKNYGFTKPRVANASMEFDSKSHSPTYRVIHGVPGESHAIETARKSGLPESIVEKAEGYMRSEKSEISTMIKELERKQRALIEREKRLNADIKKHDLEVLSFRQKENLARENGYSSLNKFMKEARKNLENLVKELKEGEITREKTLKVKEFSAEMEKRLEKEKNLISEIKLESEEKESGQYLKEGMNVVVGRYKRPGVLIRKEKNGKWIVQTGAVKMSFPVSDIKPGDQTGSRGYSVSVSGVFSGNSPSYILDIRGLRADEAALKVTKQLDSAIMKGFREFEIIHGKGEGTLQRIVEEILEESPAVESYNFAKPEAGGFGKTIVRLKE